MPIPTTPREKYRKNTLREVICQLRFPPLLKIESSAAGFQERIRQSFPFLSEKSSGMQVPEGVPPEFLQMFSQEKAYEFATMDRTASVTLAKDFVALTTSAYAEWKDFRRHLQLASDALIEEYRPSIYTRIGLRYKNVIRRSQLQLENQPWHKLLKPWALGEVALSEVASEVREAARQVSLSLERHDAQLVARHGLAQESATGEASYFIDCDFFRSAPTEVDQVLPIMDYFNQQSGNAFRWYIQRPLHDAMEPE